MTVPTEASWLDLDWTGVETSFNPGFRALADDHVKVTSIDGFGGATPLTYGVHYDVERDGDNAVTVTPIALPTAPTTLRIYRVTPATQDTDFENLAGYSPQIHTALADAAAMRAAEAERDILWAAESSATAENGWSPVFAVTSDGARRVLKVADWEGGEGDKPATGQYVGSAGWVADVGDAVDIRGATGATGPGSGDVVGDDTDVGAMQPAYYTDTGGKNVNGGKAITPAEITADQDNYNPADLATAVVIRHASDAPRSITGVAQQLSDLRPLTHVNIGDYPITLKNENASSDADKRFSLGADLVLAAGASVATFYDSTSQRWRRRDPPAPSVLMPPQGRLTLASGVPVPTADALAATTIYYTPFVGAQMPLYNGSAWTMVSIGAELSLALDGNAAHAGYHQSGKNFDIFGALDASGAPLIGTGPAWTSDTGRGTGAGTTELERQDGVWTNANQVTLRVGSGSGDTLVKSANQATYLGTFRASANGQTEMSILPNASAGGSNNKLFLYNGWNGVDLRALCRESADSWDLTSVTVRRANNSSNNRISFVIGLKDQRLEARHTGILGAAGGAGFTDLTGAIGIAYDSTTAFHANQIGGRAETNFDATASFYTMFTAVATLILPADVGFHYVQAMEARDAGGNRDVHFHGDNGGGSGCQQGLTLSIRL